MTGDSSGQRFRVDGVKLARANRPTGARGRPTRTAPAVRARRGRPRCRAPTSRPCAGPRPMACSAIRRCGVVARHAASLQPVQSHLERCFDDDHRVVLGSRASTRRAAERRGRRSRPAARPRPVRRNSSPIAGWVIASSSLRVSSETKAFAASAARSRDPSARSISGPNRSTSFASAGAPGSTTSTRDGVGIDDDRPRSVRAARDSRLAGADPAREPDHQHEVESTSERTVCPLGEWCLRVR